MLKVMLYHLKKYSDIKIHNLFYPVFLYSLTVVSTIHKLLWIFNFDKLRVPHVSHFDHHMKLYDTFTKEITKINKTRTRARKNISTKLYFVDPLF